MEANIGAENCEPYTGKIFLRLCILYISSYPILYVTYLGYIFVKYLYYSWVLYFDIWILPSISQWHYIKYYTSVETSPIVEMFTNGR